MLERDGIICCPVFTRKVRPLQIKHIGCTVCYCALLLLQSTPCLWFVFIVYSVIVASCFVFFPTWQSLFIFLFGV